jgi:hypothetical protein
MTDEHQKKLTALAKAIGSPQEIDLEKMHYHFLEGSVMVSSEGNLLGMIHRKVWDWVMKSNIDEGNDDKGG